MCRMKLCARMRIFGLCAFLNWIAFVASGEQSEIHHENVQKCSISEATTGKAGESTCEKEGLRYLIYNVNPGEGFNLRRDVYVRTAPLIQKLNDKDTEHKWILVLPPWSNIPHWSTRKVFSWSTFFQLDKINEYIPAIEFEDYMDDYGLQNGIDAVYQLQHFPFNPNEDWHDKVEFGVECQDAFPYHLDEYGEYATTLWNQRIIAKNAECVSLRGTASTLLIFLLKSQHRSFLLERAEVILWDEYGGTDWWLARKSLQFSTRLHEIAKTFVQDQVPDFNLTLNKYCSKGLIYGNSFIGVHLRRRDFLNRNSESESPSMQVIAAQIYNAMQMLDIYKVFVASDAFKHEIEELKSELSSLATGEADVNKVPTIFQFRSLDLSEGQIAIVDQIICSWSTYFIGTKESTFTTRIFEEREILGSFDPKFTFNSFCADVNKQKCEQPTQWRIS